jgi:hypothetical protein
MELLGRVERLEAANRALAAENAELKEQKERQATLIVELSKRFGEPERWLGENPRNSRRGPYPRPAV